MDIHRMCGKLIKQINDEMQKNANNALRSTNMTMVQMETLIELDSCPDKQCTLKELEHKLHVAQSTAAGIATRLERKGLVEGFGDPEDRRVKWVRITQSGMQCVLDARQHILSSEAQLLAGLTETEREIFFTLLKKVCDTLK